MQAISTTFSPQLLNDVQQLKTLFTGEEEIRALEQLPTQSYVFPEGHLYMSRWQVAWIMVTAPFRLVLYVFLKTIANFLEIFSIVGFSRKMHLRAHHLSYTFDSACNQTHYGKRLLIPLFNDYRKDISDVYTLKGIPREHILDPLIRAQLHEDNKTIEFDKFGKLCSGSVYWFNYLFMKGIKESKLNEECVSFVDYARAVSKLFEKGQPRQAALLQSLYGLQTDLVDIEEKVFKIPPSDIKSAVLLRKVPDGLYHLALPKHSVSYIKFGKEEMVMDPNVGLIRIDKPQDLLDIIHQYTKDFQGKPIFFALHSLKENKSFASSVA
ncbi:MAG: hypothetical protein KR126chlam3_00736 [Chlamydiae bacterium]|nr:hypothetical protein [Chlamydiota bacterium]